MERKAFIKNSIGFLGMAVAAPSLLKASGVIDNRQDNANMLLDGCTVSPTETAGPFPTITPANWVRTDITDGRTGIPFTIDINIMNKNANCTALQDAIVDIWHCDKDGNYSEYGGSGMQATNYTSVHFLRGRQTTNTEGLVSFASIFPGWYSGRATHIHVHVYKSTGQSLLITQISFPEGTNSAVAQVNASTANGYTKGMNGYTYNANDNVFNDDSTGAELGSVSGSVDDGFALTHTIYLSGPTLGIGQLEQQQYKLEQNYPNPFTDVTTLPLNLQYDSDINLTVFDLQGRKVYTAFNGNMVAGENNITLNRNNLSAGYYLYKVSIKNQNGSFEESKKMLVK
ncbi:MAG: T9SS type A sorting domain-containing protein [Bacteroidota bacterium]